MDIVWFAEIKWDYLKTRKQQIIRRKPDDVKLLYLEPFVRGRDNTFELREEGGILRATVPFVKTVPPGQPLRWVLDTGMGRSLVEGHARSRVRRHIRHAGITGADAGIIISNIYAVGAARRVGGRFLLYDCNDAHADFPGMPAWTRNYFEVTCRAADAVFATSQVLFDDVASVRGGDAGCELLGNGVQYRHFERVRELSGWPPPPEPPRIGYLGAIAPWFDFEAVENVARAHPDWEVSLVGPVVLGVEAEIERLAALPNVSHAAAVPYEDVPNVLGTFTLGIIPFRRNALTRGVNPNKMYEYLAMGLPVVATDFSPEVGRYPELVATSGHPDGFVRSCESLVSMAADPARLAEHRGRAVEAAARHDWSAIADRFWERVRELWTR
ncbi:MAG: glycosyltransferase [Candidatus Latescibacterota bacterium]|jgi:glycosyltransferase involved in cell wall biosynthesis